MNLPNTKLRILFFILEKTVYLSMLGLGIYFIYHGDVVPKFEKRRTNYLEYQERITELPTIVAKIYPLTKSIRFGEDIKIQFRYRNQSGSFQKPIDLTYGENAIQNNSAFTINIQDLMPYLGYGLDVV